MKSCDRQTGRCHPLAAACIGTEINSNQCGEHCTRYSGGTEIRSSRMVGCTSFRRKIRANNRVAIGYRTHRAPSMLTFYNFQINVRVHGIMSRWLVRRCKATVNNYDNIFAENFHCLLLPMPTEDSEFSPHCFAVHIEWTLMLLSASLGCPRGISNWVSQRNKLVKRTEM